MFCPKCAAKNVDDAKFCRACGADISLVPKAMTGNLTENSPFSAGNISPPDAVISSMKGWAEQGTHNVNRHDAHKRKAEASLEKAITNIFMGVAFLLVAVSVFLFAPAGKIWWFWMLLPAFGMLGSGVAEYARLKEAQRTTPPTLAPTETATTNMQPSILAPLNELQPPRNTSEMFPPPPSITEHTTRHLDTETSAET